MPIIIRRHRPPPVQQRRTPTPTNPRILIFKCANGLGNRLNNLMNMFCLHTHYPQAAIYVIWTPDHHCGCALSDLFDLSGFHWINQSPPPVHRDAFYATSSSFGATPWDSLDYWRSRPIIVSHSSLPFRFVTPQFMIDTFSSLPLTATVQQKIVDLCSTRGIGRPLIHYRQGDLLRLLCDSSDSYVEFTRRIADRLASVSPSWQLRSYNQLIPDRPREAVIIALAEMLYFARHCDLRGYCSYSTFSSWVYLLSPKFRSDRPFMTTAVVDLILLD